MKNIHILPTDKPSRLHEFGDIWFSHKEPTECFRNYNIYISSDEEIKEGDWCIDIEDSTVFKVKEQGHSGLLRSTKDSFVEDSCKKIILTTDQDLISVQAIDDEFLEWFVKNPSCESVQVENTCLEERQCMCESNENCLKDGYKIIIPQEEPTISEEAKSGYLTACMTIKQKYIDTLNGN